MQTTKMAEADAMSGKICLVTGATRGIGEATAANLAGRGATVVIVGRSQERVRQSVSRIQSESRNSQVHGFVADLSAQKEVRRLATEFVERFPKLDVLINNVGATLLTYQESPDGIELTWALNYLNHFLLTHLLLDMLKQTAAAEGESRVIEVTSSIFQIASANWQRRQQKGGYNGVLAYAQSKRAMMVFTCALARQLSGTGVTVNAVTPGYVRSGIATNSTRWARLLMWVSQPFARPLNTGVAPIVRLAAAPGLKNNSGRYYFREKERPMPRDCYDPTCAERLWKVSQEQLGPAVIW